MPAATAAFNATDHGLPEPSAQGLQVDGLEVLALWRSQRVALVMHGVDAAALRDRGLDVLVWPVREAERADVVGQLARHLA